MDSLPFVGRKPSLTLSEHKPKKAKLVEKKGKLLKRKKRREENENLAANSSQHLNKDKHAGQASGNGSLEVKTQCEIADSSGIEEADIGKRVKTKKVKKGRKSKRNDLYVSEENSKMEDINISKMDAEKVDEIPSMDEDCSRGMKTGQASGNGSLEVNAQSETVDSSSIEEAHIGERVKTKKVKKGRKSKRNDLYALEEKIKMEDNISKMDAERVDEISSVDEDCSRGMKKWLINYKESRPGLKMLQERIDDFITAYEAQQEQEMKEREALAAEGGWTVVVHHKGRKKTTDAESGITVGSVAQAAVLDNMARKKNKEVAVDFYRFQKREAQRSEVMMLQSKFEQDKKRIQQLRAARKFRPY